MPRGKALFKSGRFLRTGMIPTRGTPEELNTHLREHELGLYGDALYTKIGGRLILLLEGTPVYDLFDLDIFVNGTFSPLELKVDTRLEQITLKCKHRA